MSFTSLCVQGYTAIILNALDVKVSKPTLKVVQQLHKRYTDVAGMLRRNGAEILMGAAMASLNIIFVTLSPMNHRMVGGAVLLTGWALCLVGALCTFRAMRDLTWHAVLEPIKVSCVVFAAALIGPTVLEAIHRDFANSFQELVAVFKAATLAALATHAVWLTKFPEDERLLIATVVLNFSFFFSRLLRWDEGVPNGWAPLRHEDNAGQVSGGADLTSMAIMDSKPLSEIAKELRVTRDTGMRELIEAGYLFRAQDLYLAGYGSKDIKDMGFDFRDMSEILTFEVNGEEKEIGIAGKPLGAEFDTKMPIKVMKVSAGSVAEEAGVTEGMVLVRVAGKDITHMEYDVAFKELDAFIGKLK
jgi:hypothetical protein